MGNVFPRLELNLVVIGREYLFSEEVSVLETKAIGFSSPSIGVKGLHQCHKVMRQPAGSEAFQGHNEPEHYENTDDTWLPQMQIVVHFPTSI